MSASHASATILALVFDLALKSTVLLIVAAGIVLALRRRAAATRHLVWGLALGGVVLLPLLSASLPRWQVPGLTSVPAWNAVISRQAVRAAPHAASIAPSATVPPSQPTVRELPAQPSTGQAATHAIAPAARPAAGLASLTLSPTAWLVMVWLAGAVAILATIVLGLWRAGRRARQAHRVHDGAVLTLAEAAANHLKLARPVRLLQAPRPAMPATWGAMHPVVLLPSDLASWTRSRLEAVLLHELAHVKRHDYLTQLVAAVACALCWFHPLVWFAARQLRVEREHACDDLVLCAGSRASDYAQQLLDIARTLRASPLQAVATIAMARPSQLAGRLLAVLDGSRPRGVATRRVVTRAAAAAALIVMPVAGASAGDPRAPSVLERHTLAAPTTTVANDPWLPLPANAASAAARHAEPAAMPQQVCDWENGEENSSSTSINDDRMRIRLEMDPDCRIDLDATGKVQYSNDFTDVTGLDRNGSFTLERRDGRERRRLEIEPGPGGPLVRHWYVNGQLQAGATATDAREWLAGTLTIVFRHTAYQAKERSAWILRQGGVPALLAEVGHIHSDYAASTYYRVLLTQKQLDAATLRSVVEDAGQRIHSDYALSQLLQAVAQHQSMDHTVEVAYVAAAGNIDSDYEKGQALSAVLKRPDLTQDVADAMLREATTMHSDYELAKLLRGLIAAHPIAQNMTPIFFQAVSSIGSDYERHGVLRAMLEQGPPSQDVLDRTLEAAQGMSSDYELAGLLLEVAQKYPVDRALPASYVKAARSLTSDHEQGRVWAALLDRSEIAPSALTAVLDAAGSIGSDFELSTLLRAFLARHPLDDATRPAFFRAASGISSDYEIARVLMAALDAKPVARATVLGVIKASSGIGSDHDLGEVLMHVADVVPLDDELRAELRAASDRIESSYTRGQVLAKIYPRGKPA
jgi:beta-lactamase regulating signal transducer with metallopeptidase domain